MTLFPSSTGATLTDREWEVAQLLAFGASRKAIAKQLNISVHTVDTHLDRIRGKVPGGGRRALDIARYVLAPHSTGIAA